MLASTAIGLIVVAVATGAFVLGHDTAKRSSTASTDRPGSSPRTSASSASHSENPTGKKPSPTVPPSTSLPPSGPMSGQYVNLADTSMSMVVTVEASNVTMALVGVDEQYVGTASGGVMVLTQSCTSCDAGQQPETATFGAGLITFAGGPGSPCAGFSLQQGESCVFDYDPTQG